MARRRKPQSTSHSRGSSDTKHVFASGAMNSGKKPKLHLIPYAVFTHRLANIYALGAEKYGVANWERGLNDREFVLDRANHMLEHAHKAVEALRDRKRLDTDDDLAATIFGAILLMAAGE